MTINFCYYTNPPHPRAFMDGYTYYDPANGIKDCIYICPECYAKHILKYYPNTRIAKDILLNPDNYRNKEVQS